VGLGVGRGVDMAGTVRRLIDAGLRRSPMQPYFAKRTAGLLAVLAYHDIDRPENFARHLDLLLRVMRPIGLDEVLAAWAGEPLPPRSVLVTFDDGYRSVLDHAAPMLAEREIPAVAFVIANLLGSEEPYWWVEIEHLVRCGGRSNKLQSIPTPHQAVLHLKRLPDDARREAIHELRATASGQRLRQQQLKPGELGQLEVAGVEIGNHTFSHPCLDTCDDATVAAEIIESHKRLTETLGREPRAFAYPNGNWDPRAENQLSNLCYSAAFLFDHRHARPGSHALRISRLRVNSTTSIDRFAAILSGLHPAVHNARGGR